MRIVSDAPCRLPHPRRWSYLLSLIVVGWGCEVPRSLPEARAEAPGTPSVAAAEWAPASGIGHSITADSVQGLVMFRGNATRSYYGRGPVPSNPRILWRVPGRAMCATSWVNREPREWCGTGWTGQPSVIERGGRTEVIVGAYDRQVHFLDAATGAPLRPSLSVGDIIKGSVTVDPDGYPLVYSGSRDGNFRIIAIDRPRPTTVWSLPASSAPRPMWNDDWDGNAVVLRDHLFEGGENGWFYIVRLNRRYDASGLVQVDPTIVFLAPGFDDEQLRALGDRDVSIENSVVLFGNRAYIGNSGGLISGFDLTHLVTDPSRVTRTFRFWGGDDINATMVVDERGMLYVGAEDQRSNARMREMGQLYSLDPSRPEHPVRWKRTVPRGSDFGGVYATPALYGSLLLVPTNAGVLLAVDRDSGAERWRLSLGWHAWSSPVVVDSTLIVADCQGRIQAFDMRQPNATPPLRWAVTIPSRACIESTPALWRGRLYVGARDGFFYALGDG